MVTGPEVDFRHSHRDQDVAIFLSLGYTSAVPLGKGMEAAAFRLSVLGAILFKHPGDIANGDEMVAALASA